MIVRQAAIEDAAAIARVHVDAWRETYPGIVPQAELDGLDVEDKQAMWQEVLAPEKNRKLMLIAEDKAGSVVGFASGQITGGKATIPGIYLLKSAQGRGLGARLMARLAEGLAEAGAGEVHLEVATENHGARGFYERLGGTCGEVQSCTAAVANVPAVTYTWPSPKNILKHCAGG